MEMARRCIRIRIDPKIDRPWQRTGFKHPDLIGWTRIRRPQLARAVLTLIHVWIEAGKPLGTQPFGSFEEWAGVIGGILQVAGIPGFLGNLDSLYEEADQEGADWREFTAAWWDEFTMTPKTAKDLNYFCDDRELMTTIRGEHNDRSQQTRLGKALKSARDRVFGSLKIIHAGREGYSLRMEGTDENEALGAQGV